MAIAKIFKKAAKAADRAMKENQKKPINELMSLDKGQQKESGMGTASKQRIRSAERSKEFAGIKKQYERDLKKLKTDKNLTDEQMERLMDKLRDMRQKLTDAGIKVPAMNKGGAAKKKKKVPVISIGVGMATVGGKKPRTGSKDYRNGGMVMSSGNNLKKVPAGNKGLKKLPTAVRNKMGFMKKGGMAKK